MGLVQPLPCGQFRPDHDAPIGLADVAGKALLDVLAEPVVGRESGHLWALGGLLRFPLSNQRPVLWLPAPGDRAAAQFAGDRCRVTTDPACDLTNANLLGA